MKLNTIASATMIVVMIMIGMIFDQFFVMFGILDVDSFDIMMTRTTAPKEVMLGLIGIVVILSLYLVYLMMKNMKLKKKQEIKP